jgi:molybdopterin converting factor small subunit
VAKAGLIAVNVRYYNMLRNTTGVQGESVALPPGTTLRAALEDLITLHGPRLREMLFTPDGELSSHLVIFHNQRLVRQDHDRSLGDPGPGLSLADGDELMLFPAIAGG